MRRIVPGNNGAEQEPARRICRADPQHAPGTIGDWRGHRGGGLVQPLQVEQRFGHGVITDLPRFFRHAPAADALRRIDEAPDRAPRRDVAHPLTSLVAPAERKLRKRRIDQCDIVLGPCEQAHVAVVGQRHPQMVAEVDLAAFGTDFECRDPG